MKKTTISKGIIQGLIFNIIIFISFIFLGINYFFPEYNSIEDKKNELNKLEQENNDLLTKGLQFTEFKKMYLKDSGIDSYLKNIFLDPSKDIETTYKSNLINNGTGTYKNFIKAKNEEIKEREKKLDNTKIKEKIEKILPFYKSDSSLEEKGMTDFEFVNYMENIIHNFGLVYEGNIGIGNLSLENSDSKYLKKQNKEQIDGEIYSFKLNLDIKGPKKNIIDFIHYLDNVGSIDFTDDGENIEVQKASRQKMFKDKNGNYVKNNFRNISNYFFGKEDIYNNLVVDIDSIKMGDYIDSLLEPISYDKGETFINYIKNTQENEKYEVSLVLKFYVKGLEKYKSKEYINNVISEYSKLKKIISNGIKFGKRNKSSLSIEAQLSLKKLIKINNYLNFISKDIKDLSNKKRQQNELGNVFKEAQKFKKVFDNIYKSFDINLKNVSKKIYDNYKETLKKENKLKKEKND